VPAVRGVLQLEVPLRRPSHDQLSLACFAPFFFFLSLFSSPVLVVPGASFRFVRLACDDKNLSAKQPQLSLRASTACVVSLHYPAAAAAQHAKRRPWLAAEWHPRASSPASTASGSASRRYTRSALDLLSKAELVVLIKLTSGFRSYMPLNKTLLKPIRGFKGSGDGLNRDT
jgi:hypothetical protein